MPTNQQILVIENQRKQYETLVRRLPEYTILPPETLYSQLTDYVRIFLNERYTETRRTIAFNALMGIINGCDKIDLLIIDYKLTGCHDGGSGITLAKSLRKQSKLERVPIIFLSRTPENDEAVLDELATISFAKWIPKSYAGLQNLDRVFFNKYVKKILPELIGEPQREKLCTNLDVLIGDPYFETIKQELQEIKNIFGATGQLSDDKKKLIQRLLNEKSELTPYQITTIGQELKQ